MCVVVVGARRSGRVEAVEGRARGKRALISPMARGDSVGVLCVGASQVFVGLASTIEIARRVRLVVIKNKLFLFYFNCFFFSLFCLKMYRFMTEMRDKHYAQLPDTFDDEVLFFF